MSIRTILFASVLACVGAAAGQQSAAYAQPVMPPPPSYPVEPAQQGYPAPTQPAQGYPAPAQAYPPPAQPAPAYPAPQQQPAPAPQQPAQAYPPPQQPASSYPQPGQYPPQGYPPQQQQPQQGYPPPPPQQGYPPPQQGYPPPPPQQGYPPPQQGYPPPQQGYPPPPVDEAAPPPPAPEPEVERESVFANPLSKLQVGFQLGMGSLTTDNPTYNSDLTSLGIFARYRFNERWEAELAVASESGTVEANNAVRDFTPITASALFHVINLRGVDAYGRAGLGRATEVYDNPMYSPLEGSTTHFHLGAGASYIFRRNIAAGVEMRWNRISRGSSDDLSPLVGSGTVYSAYGAYHF
jgi:hypothetical protein